ncbi:MAG: 2-hydroxyacid dehydrogenase [Planctomycetota bacterium]|nr:2-hydroxyacid dehydrogenase [Planctomycetota bacterium]
MDEAIERAGEFEIIVSHRIGPEMFDRADRLKFYIIPFTGLPVSDREELLRRRHITVLNSHFNAVFAAEHALGLLLTAARHTIPAHDKMKKGDWTPRYAGQWGVTMLKRNVLLLGFGAIGRKLAEMLRPFDAHISAVSRTGGDSHPADFHGTSDDLHRLLPEADALICTLPHTPATDNFVNADVFERLKEGAVFVNVGRGPVVNEKALHDALSGGRLRAAAIDTWWHYPSSEEMRSKTPPSRFPLNEFENVVFSPHRATHVEGREFDRMEDVARLVNSCVNGEPHNIVDLEELY